MNVQEPRYGVAPGYGLPVGANDGFQEVFTSSMTAAAGADTHFFIVY